MFVVKAPCIHFCYVTNRTEFAQGSGLKTMAVHNFNFSSSNCMDVTLSGPSKLAPFPLRRINLLNRWSYSLWKDNRGDNLAVSSSCWDYACHQLRQMGKATPTVITLTRKVREAFSEDEWSYICNKLISSFFVVLFIFIIGGRTIRMPPWRWILAYFGAVVREERYQPLDGFFLRIWQLFETGEGAEQKHKGNLQVCADMVEQELSVFHQISLKKLHDGWSVRVKEIPVHIDDLNKVPLILDDIEHLIESDDIFLATEPPFCRLSQLKSSYAELTFGCYIKQMSEDKALMESRKRLTMYVEVIKKHGGTPWRKHCVS